jgi:hypothetical protein
MIPKHQKNVTSLKLEISYGQNSLFLIQKGNGIVILFFDNVLIQQHQKKQDPQGREVCNEHNHHMTHQQRTISNV